jgi:hypothetical protein
MSFGSPGNNFAEVLLLISQTIHDVRLRGTLARATWQLQAGYGFSMFNQGVRSVVADNPCLGLTAAVAANGCAADATGAPATGRMSVEPDNMALARNAMHVTCHPDGLGRYIENWEEFAGPFIQTLHREAAHGTNAAAARLRDAVLAYPGMPPRWRTPDPRAPAPPVLTMRLKRDDSHLALFSTLTTLATPRDSTLEQLRIECFYPADRETEATACSARRLRPPSRLRSSHGQAPGIVGSRGLGVGCGGKSPPHSGVWAPQHPSRVTGLEEERLQVFRRVRNEIPDWDAAMARCNE